MRSARPRCSACRSSTTRNASWRSSSLAIGKKGQNVRLAAKLTGWRIDIKSEEEKRKEVEAQFGALEAGDAQAQMDALFPETPSGELSAEATTEQSEEGDVAKAEAGDVAAAEETEKQES